MSTLKLSLRLLIGVLFIAPLYWIVVIATGTSGSAYRIPPVFFPAFHMKPMLYVMFHTHWLQYVFNSVFITGMTIILVLLTSITTGYALADIEFPGKNFYFFLILGVMMLPGQALLIPQYVVMYHLHLLNTYTSMILPFAATTAGVFLFRQFFMKIPASYREVARIEGVSTLRYILRVAVPLARPAVFTVILLTFISSWNQFQWPLIMTNSHHIDPIELALSHYMQSFQANWRKLTSAATLALIPIVIVFLFTQKYIVSGVAGGDVGTKE